MNGAEFQAWLVLEGQYMYYAHPMLLGQHRHLSLAIGAAEDRLFARQTYPHSGRPSYRKTLCHLLPSA